MTMDKKLLKRVKMMRGDPRFFYAPHAKQKAFHDLGLTNRERLFLAGNRVGKTIAGAAEMSFHLTGLYPDWWQGVRYEKPISAWAASVTREATRDILQACYVGSNSGAKGVIMPHLIKKKTMRSGVTGAVDTLWVAHVSGGVSELSFKSFDQGRETFQGTVRDVIHLDEEPDIGIYEECLLRTMTCAQGRLMLTMTPLLGMTEMVASFVQSDPVDGKAVVSAGWHDAPHLDEQTKAGLRRSLRLHEVEARMNGVPKLVQGRVYPIEEELIKCPRFEIAPTWKRCFGLDFGWSNPTAVAWLAYDPTNDVIYVTDVYCRSEATPSQHAEAIKRLGDWIPGVCDPAGQAANQRDGVSLIQMYAKAGMRLERADNDVEAGLMDVLERMRDGRLKVFDDLDPWWREFRQYGRDSKGKIIKRNDHLMDATRYAVMSGLSVARPALVLKNYRKRETNWRKV